MNIERWRMNCGSMICLGTVAYAIYYVLIKDNLLPLSITSILSWTNHLTQHWQVLAIGLLPIYLALVIFGTAVLGIYLGSCVQRWLTTVLRF